MDSGSDFFKILPQQSADKLAGLLDAREAAHEAYLAAHNRFYELHTDYSRLRNRHRDLTHRGGVDAAYAQFSVAAVAPTDDNDFSAPEIADAKRRVDRASTARDSASATLLTFNFLQTVTDWVRDWAHGGGPLAFAPLPEVRLSRGESYRDAVDRVRSQISAVDDEWRKVENAPLPLEVLKAEIAEQFDKLADLGRPRFTGRVSPGNPEDVATATRPTRTGHDGPINLTELLYPRGADGTVRSHAAPFLMWAQRDAILARLFAEAEKLDFSEAMDDSARENAFARLLDQRLKLSWEEEAFIVEAASAGISVVRRQNCDPRAVLQVVTQ